MRGTDEIRHYLRQRQVQLRESDAAFAARLGITRQSWQRTRTGVDLGGPKLLQGAVKAFPELTTLVQALFLPEKASILNANGKHADLVEAVS